MPAVVSGHEDGQGLSKVEQASGVVVVAGLLDEADLSHWQAVKQRFKVAWSQEVL